MESKSAQEGLMDMERQLEAHRRTIRRADVVLYLIAILAAAIVIFLPGVREHTNFAIALPLIAFAVIAVIAVFLFPWHRYHPDLFVSIGILAIVQISALIWVTGGQLSPFSLFYFFVVVAAGAYHRTLWPLILIIGLSVLGVASFLIYSRAWDMQSVGFLSILTVVLTTVAFITAIFFRSLAKTAEQLEKRVRELTALNNMFQEYLHRDQSQSKEPDLAWNCIERLKADIAQLDQLLRRSSL